jgi:hypothetical protein
VSSAFLLGQPGVPSDSRASLMGPVMSSRPVRQILVSMSTVIARSPAKRDIFDWARPHCKIPPDVSPADYLLFSVVSTKGCQHNAIRRDVVSSI